MSDYIYKAFFVIIITVYIRFVNVYITNVFYNISFIFLLNTFIALLLIFRQCLNKLRTVIYITLKKKKKLKNNKVKILFNYKLGLKKIKNKKNNKSKDRKSVV